MDQTINDSNVITIDELMTQTGAIEEVPKETNTITKKKDKILIIQISLLVVWAILTGLVYFFGYDLFEPFIKV